MDNNFTTPLLNYTKTSSTVLSPTFHCIKTQGKSLCCVFRIRNSLVAWCCNVTVGTKMLLGDSIETQWYERFTLATTAPVQLTFAPKYRGWTICRAQQLNTSWRFFSPNRHPGQCTAAAFKRRILGPWHVCRQTSVEVRPVSSCPRLSCAYDRWWTSVSVWLAAVSALHHRSDLQPITLSTVQTPLQHYMIKQHTGPSNTPPSDCISPTDFPQH